MIDPELKSYLNDITKYTYVMHKRTGGRANAFFNGIFTGFGSVVGIVLALALIGWVLNIVGVIPAFQNQVDDWQKLLQQAQTKQFSPYTPNNQSK